MNNVFDWFLQNQLSIQSIQCSSLGIMIQTKDYLYRIQKKTSEEIWHLLEKIQFPYYIVPKKSTDEYDIFEYKENYDSNEKKAEEMISAFLSLHSKTQKKEEVPDSFFSNFEVQMNTIWREYDAWLNGFSFSSFPKLDSYYLLTHISIFFESLWMAQNQWKRWRESNPTTIRKSFQIHNIDFSNFIGSSSPFFLDVSHLSKDFFFQDIVLFLKKAILLPNCFSLWENYSSQMEIQDDEWYLLSSFLCLTPFISLEGDSYDNIIATQQEIRSLEKILELVLKENEKRQKTNEEKF